MNKPICTCSCHVIDADLTHMQPCCTYTYEKYINTDLTIDFDKYNKLLQKMKEYEVWTEGYLATGMEGIPAKAQLHGKFKGNSFKEAIQAFKDTLTDSYSIECVDVENMNFWGCRFFDNETDARKSFG